MDRTHARARGMQHATSQTAATLILRQSGLLGTLGIIVAIAGCAKPDVPIVSLQRPDVAPVRQEEPADALKLDSSQIDPMFTEMLAVDLPTVLKVAAAENFDIHQAREAVQAAEGEYESAIGSAFPVIAPTALFEHVEGTVRATEGNLVGVGFNTFQPSVAIQWVINPGSIIYRIVAAKKRFFASEQRERAVVLESLRVAAVQYYALVLNQAQVAAADRGVSEAEELLRISRLRRQIGTGVPADEMRAEARLAERQQDLVSALKTFYDSSVALAVTLHLDSSVTLVPSAESIWPIQLVREDIHIDELLEIAMGFRPDLQSVRTLVEAATADGARTWWSGFGPEFALSYQYGGLTGHANNVVGARGIPGNLVVNPASSSGAFGGVPIVSGLVKEGIARGSRRLSSRGDQTYGFSDQQRASAGVGWRLGLSIFGELKTSTARERQAVIHAEQQLDRVRAEVVTSTHASKAHRRLVALARRQVVSAEEALRLSEVNLQAGTMTTLDVLQAQDAATQARLRRAEAVVRYNQSQVNLLAALGLLDEESLTTTPTEEEDSSAGDLDEAGRPPSPPNDSGT